MKTPVNPSDRPAGGTGAEAGVRPVVKIIVLITCFICLGLITVHLTRSGSKSQAKTAQSKPAVTARLAAPKPTGLASGVRGNAQIAPAVHIEPAPVVRQLVDSLVYLDTSGGGLTDEQATDWQKGLQRLIRQGDAAVPAISEFLEKNTDVVFGREESARLGYPSARMAMLDALAQIASAQARGAMDAVLQATMNPIEIALITEHLEKAEPGLFLQHAFDAVQRTLTSAAAGNTPAVDVGPLFQVLQQYQYGNAYTVPVLKDSANQWNHYAMITLANLPDGAGVPAMIQIATGQEASSPGARTAALEALSGLAAQSADAREAMVALARQNCLSAYDWSVLVPFLAGNQTVFQDSLFGNPVAGVSPTDLRATYVSASRQSFWTAPLGAMNARQIAQQKAFLDQMAAATADPAAIRALQQAKSMLENRLLLLANSPGQ